MDFGMPTGTKIKALTDGTVTQSGWANGGGGNQITLKEPGGKWYQWYMHMSKLIAKKGDKVKAGDLLGLSGNTGNSTTPHLHIQRMKGYPSNETAVNPKKWLESLKGGGKGGGKYGKEIKQALGMAGLPQTSKYIKAWQEQARTESTFNPKAYNPSGASGLVQVKPATFNQYKLPGHGNIWNPLDNLIAGMRYAKARYGKKGMLNQIGHGLPYYTGGIISTDGTYRLADGGYPEAVMSLDPARASDTMKLMNYVQSKIGTSDKKNKRPNQIPNKYASNSQSNNSAELNMMAQQLQATQEQNNLLMQLLGVTKNIEGQPKGFNEKDVSQAQGDRARMKKFNLGM